MVDDATLLTDLLSHLPDLVTSKEYTVTTTNQVVFVVVVVVIVVVVVVIHADVVNLILVMVVMDDAVCFCRCVPLFHYIFFTISHCTRNY